MNYSSIKLDKKHQPINPSLCIHTQIDYDYYMAVLNYLYQQVDMGFKPKYLVSLHYQNPAEYCKPIRETNKPLGFGEGGAIIVDNKYEKAIRCLSNFGIGYSENKYFLKDGSNYKMSDISAAYILQYLSNFDEIIIQHKKIYLYMEEKLQNIEGINLYKNFSSETPFLSCFCLLFDNYNDKIRKRLLDNNIFCRKYYNPLKNTPTTMKIYNRILCVPCTKDMSESDIDKIIDLIVFV